MDGCKDEWKDVEVELTKLKDIVDKSLKRAEKMSDGMRAEVKLAFAGLER